MIPTLVSFQIFMIPKTDFIFCASLTDQNCPTDYFEETITAQGRSYQYIFKYDEQIKANFCTSLFLQTIFPGSVIISV